MTDEKDFLKGTCPINPDDLDSCEACQQGYGVLQYKSTSGYQCPYVVRT